MLTQVLVYHGYDNHRSPVVVEFNGGSLSLLSVDKMDKIIQRVPIRKSPADKNWWDEDHQRIIALRNELEALLSKLLIEEGFLRPQNLTQSLRARSVVQPERITNHANRPVEYFLQ